LNNIDLKIGLAFSGGGFRASSFSLGVLSYLNEVSVGNVSLLSKVYALSTISGGTIAGARYALGIKNGESFNTIYWSLYDFMSDTDLIGISLNNLVSKKEKDDSRPKSLITAFADAYDLHLFNKEKFGILQDESNPIHLKNISFNATEFQNALQFRFQTTEKIKNPYPDEPERGIIGNHYYRIPEEIAKDIRMADILAASSCFPGGFEPINFPTDFVFSQSDPIHSFIDIKNLPVGLMDGGIVDNQGIEPLLLAEKRMKRNRAAEHRPRSEQNEFDLLIISDVTSPYMDGYKPNNRKKLNFWRRLTFRRLIVINLIILLASLAGIVFSVKNNLQLWSIVFAVLITTNIFLYLTLLLIKKLPRKFQVPAAFTKPLSKLLKVQFAEYENMILNRSNSLLKMTNEVFLKHIRRLNYNKIFQDKSWKNRRIMNGIYELRLEEEKLRTRIENEKLSTELTPSAAIQKVASTASSMGTTLWFTQEELNEKNMLNSIIACGQFTMCWNLLEYIYKIKNDAENTNPKHTQLLQIESQLLAHWQRFNANPFWMVNEIKR